MAKVLGTKFMVKTAMACFEGRGAMSETDIITFLRTQTNVTNSVQSFQRAVERGALVPVGKDMYAPNYSKFGIPSRVGKPRERGKGKAMMTPSQSFPSVGVRETNDLAELATAGLNFLKEWEGQPLEGVVLSTAYSNFKSKIHEVVKKLKK